MAAATTARIRKPALASVAIRLATVFETARSQIIVHSISEIETPLDAASKARKATLAVLLLVLLVNPLPNPWIPCLSYPRLDSLPLRLSRQETEYACRKSLIGVKTAQNRTLVYYFSPNGPSYREDSNDYYNWIVRLYLLSQGPYPSLNSNVERLYLGYN